MSELLSLICSPNLLRVIKMMSLNFSKVFLISANTSYSVNSSTAGWKSWVIYWIYQECEYINMRIILKSQWLRKNMMILTRVWILKLNLTIFCSRSSNILTNAGMNKNNFKNKQPKKSTILVLSLSLNLRIPLMYQFPHFL